MNFSDLLKKYNVPGPRYTSYPTVPYWDTEPQVPTTAEWISSISRSLEKSSKESVGASLYVHVPFCESLCTYCGCNTRITRNRSVGAPYIETVHQELDLYLKQLGLKQPLAVSEIHLGGGTPTFLSPQELESLVSGILSRIQLTPDYELSLEADPRVTQREHLAALARLGFKRLSLGIQDFDPRVQEIVHRTQSEEQVRRVVDTARELGFTSVNFDLIYGLPLQTQESVAATIQAVRRLRPDRIAFYSYAHVPWIKASQRRFTEADLPDGDAKRGLYELGRKLLEEVGYREIGMDHFALETDSLWKASQEGTLHRNFMGYMSRRVEPLIGLGVSAIGDSGFAFAQNEKLLETYLTRVRSGELPLLRGHLLTDEDREIRQQILNLMTRFETSWNEDSPARDFLCGVADRLHDPLTDGLVELEGHTCKATVQGRPFLRNICMAFDARLARSAESNTRKFSKTV